MQLATFVSGLIDDGQVSVEGEILPLEDTDRDKTILILKEFYDRDVAEMPYVPPAFNDAAALWAAQHIYLCTQLSVLRHLDEEEVKKHLVPFTNAITAECIYSADLMLRFLPQLYDLAKGLAPADILVAQMQNTAAYWPFSSVGIEITESFNIPVILAHPSLKYAYIDRIIDKKDMKRAVLDAGVKNIVTEILGAYTATLWPQLAAE